MDKRSVPRIPPAIIPRWRWNQLERLCLLTEKAVGLAQRSPKLGLPVAAGCAELLGTAARAAAWRVAGDEEREKGGESAEDASAGETCVVEVRLGKDDRSAIEDLMSALDRAEAKVQ